MRCSLIILLFTFLISQVLSSPYCQVVSDTFTRFYTLPSESSYLDISRYFRGHNLTFEVHTEDNNYVLTPPVTIVEEYPIPDLTPNETHVQIDVLSDNQYQYKEQGVLLSKNTNGTIFVRFGDLDENNGIDFKTKIEYQHTDPINCFDILMLDYNTALVDCQKLNDPRNTDVILIVKNGVVKVGTEKPNNIVTEKRKLQSYRTENKTFVLSILLSDFIDDHKMRNQSYINTYIYNHTLNTVEFLVVINWETLGDYQLTISDVDMDPFGFVYLADNSESEDYLIVRFKINDDATLDSLLAFDLNEKPARLSTVFVNGVFLVEVATADSIIEIDWTNEPKLISSYELPENIGEIIDVQMNEQVIMLSTSTGFYFYGIKQYKERELLHHFEMKNGVVLLDKVNIYGIFVDHNTSYTYTLSSGSLVLTQPTKEKLSSKNTSNLIFKATSASHLQKKSCEVIFQITVIQNRYSIYIQKQPPIMFTLENPANHTVYLESYYLGSLITYKPRTVANVKYTVHSINDIKYQTDYPEFDQSLGTFSVSQNTLVKGAKIGANIVLELCTYAYLTQSMTCDFLRNIPEDGDILSSFFMKVLEDVVLVYTSSSEQGTIRFINILKGYQQFPPITLYSNMIAITDLCLSEQIIIINFQELSSLILYKISSSEIKYFMEINRESFPEQLKQQFSVFQPDQIKIGQPRLIYILNDNLIIIMRLTSIDATYISYIDIPVPDNEPSDIDYKIYKSTITIVIQQINTIIQYNVANPYQPLLLQSHRLQNHTIQSLSIDNHIDNSFLFITSQYLNDTYIHVYKAGVPAVSAYYFRKVIPSNTPLVSAIVHHTLVIFGANSESAFGFRVYSHATISITSQSVKDLFKTIRPYGFTIQSQSHEILFLGTLRVVNYQTAIKVKDSKKHHIFLPMKIRETLLSLPKQMFTGPIARYDIDCSDCLNKIELQSYTYPIGEVQYQHPTQRFLYFTAHMEIIWILTNNSIQVVDPQLNQLSPRVEICVNCFCTNFQVIDYQFIIIFCTRPNSHKFFTIVKSINNIDIQVHRTFQLPNSLVIQNCFDMKVIKNRLFILDNNIEGTGKGEIRVFKITNVLNDIIRVQFQTTLDYSNFQIEEQTSILGFDIVPLEMYEDAKYFALILTLGDKGLGYLCFNSDYEIFDVFGKGNYYDLNRDSSISSYVLDNNEYQQIRWINDLQEGDDEDEEAGEGIQVKVVISSTYGCHLQLLLIFNLTDTLALTDLQLINTFNKYGSQKVLNWMGIVKTGMSFPFHVGIAHYNQSTSIFSITLYPMQEQPTSQSINFISSVSIQHSNQLPMDLIGAMTPFNEQSIMVYHPISGSNIFYNITSDTMYLILNYEDISQDITEISLVASNDYSSARELIQVTHDSMVPNNHRWYIYTIGGVAVFLILGGLGFGITKYFLGVKKGKSIKRSTIRDQKKISLIDSKDQIDIDPNRGSINLEQDEI